MPSVYSKKAHFPRGTGIPVHGLAPIERCRYRQNVLNITRGNQPDPSAAFRQIAFPHKV